MAVTSNSFRQHFPEFADRKVYADPAFNYWNTVAGKMVNAARWFDMLDTGIELFVAHNLVLEKQALDAAAVGGAPGLSTGPVNSKSVDKVSVAYDTAAALEVGAGHWNLTVYGTRFVALSKMFGAGPIHIGGGDSLALSGGAWPGPYVY